MVENLFSPCHSVIPYLRFNALKLQHVKSHVFDNFHNMVRMGAPCHIRHLCADNDRFTETTDCLLGNSGQCCPNMDPLWKGEQIRWSFVSRS